jgi:hypothetical protein
MMELVYVSTFEFSRNPVDEASIDPKKEVHTIKFFCI